MHVLNQTTVKARGESLFHSVLHNLGLNKISSTFPTINIIKMWHTFFGNVLDMNHYKTCHLFKKMQLYTNISDNFTTLCLVIA